MATVFWRTDRRTGRDGHFTLGHSEGPPTVSLGAAADRPGPSVQRVAPGRGEPDLVGIDNRRAGFVVTDHLLRSGARRVAFVGVPHSASTVDEREAGHREALHARGLELDRALVRRLDPSDPAAVRGFVDTVRPDGIVCANDWTAARLMHALIALGFRVPTDVRLVGIDDVEYAALLPAPLTTYRQPARQLGAVALSAMLERIAQPDLPTRDILLHGELVVRESCGARAPIAR